MNLLIMICCSVIYSIGMQNISDCVMQVGPWMQTFIFYECGISFLDLAVVFAIQNHIIMQIGQRDRTVFEESKSLLVLRIFAACVLIYITTIGNSLYFNEHNVCLKSNKLFFYSMMLILIFCYFQLMMVIFIIVAFIILVPILIYYWCTNRTIGSQWYPTSRSVMRHLQKKKIGRDQEALDPEVFCAICLEYYSHDDYITTLPCDSRHLFHTKCIEQWLSKNNKCPLCKKMVDI